jgi:colanic acid biosynthesis glycosyl transferase WcaI
VSEDAGESVLRPADPPPTRPYLLVISQVYVPDPAAVGQYVADVSEEMVRRGWQVCVYAASRGYDDPTTAYPPRETRSGVSIRRLPWASFGKGSIAVRLLAQSVFLAQAFLRGLTGPRPDLILVSTSPPFAGFVGSLLAWCRGTPFAWWVMDINPDQMIAAGKLSHHSVLARLFDWMNRVTLRRAAAVITLDHFMADRLCQKLADRALSPTVVPPWPLASAFAAPNVTSSFRSRHGLDGSFVVMYSGNHALQHPLTTLLDAARALENDPRMVFVFVGGGAGKRDVESRIAAGARNLRSLPPVPLEDLADVLTAADLHVVTMGNDMAGIVHPSKIYSAMAVGKPVLFFGPAASRGADLVGEHHVGWVVPHGDIAGAVAAMRAAVSDPSQLAAMGRRAAGVMAATLAPERLRGEVCDVLTSIGGQARCAIKA